MAKRERSKERLSSGEKGAESIAHDLQRSCGWRGRERSEYASNPVLAALESFVSA